MPLAFPKPSATRQRIVNRREREADLVRAKREVWGRDGYLCRICGRSVSNRGPLESRGEVAHLVARSKSKGLRAETSNLILACRLCHSDMHTYKIVVTGSGNGQITIKKGVAA